MRCGWGCRQYLAGQYASRHGWARLFSAMSDLEEFIAIMKRFCAEGLVLGWQSCRAVRYPDRVTGTIYKVSDGAAGADRRWSGTCLAHHVAALVRGLAGRIIRSARQEIVDDVIVRASK